MNVASICKGIFAAAGCTAQPLAASALAALVRGGATPEMLRGGGYPDEVVEQLQTYLLQRLGKVPVVPAR